MSTPRPPDRFEKAVNKMLAKAQCRDNCTCQLCPAINIVTLLRREHATAVKIITARMAYHEARKKQINDHDGHRERYEKEKECIYTLQFILEQLAVLGGGRQ